MFAGGAYPAFNVMAFSNGVVINNGIGDATAAIQAALDAAHANGGGVVYIPAGTYLVGQLNMPGDNIAVLGAGSGYVYGSGGAVRTKLKAKPGTTIVFNLVVTGLLVDRTGCLLQDFEVDGDLIATYGIKVATSNLLNRVKVRGCLTAGCLLADGTNATRITNCGFVSNFGWGLRVQGQATTAYSVNDTNLTLNQLGGADLQAGVVVNFARCIFESNSGPGLRIFKPDSHTGAMGGFTFDTCWLEDDGVNAPNFTLEIDAQTRNETNAPWRIAFKNCRFAPSVAARKYFNIPCAKWVTFDDCQFAGSTAADTFTLGTEARFVAWSECEKGFDGSAQPTDAQYDAAIAVGFRCYRTARDVRYSVGSAGKPAFNGAWVNSGGGFAPARYWFDREGNVHIEGHVKTGAVPGVMFNLPVGYRPSTPRRFPTSANGAFGALEVDAAGNVSALAGSNADFALNGISFPTG